MKRGYTCLGDISTLILHGYQIVRSMNDGIEPRFVYGSREKRALELLFELRSVNLVRSARMMNGHKPVMEAKDRLEASD